MKHTPPGSKLQAEKPDHTRRIAMTAVISAGLSSKHWIRPAVDSVILPAHANTSSATELQYFADISTQINLVDASSALLCVEILDENYVGKLAVVFEGGQIDVFTTPSTPLGQVSIMTGVCQPGGPFLAQNPDQQSLTVAFEEGMLFSIPLATCALPAANCTSSSVQAAKSSSVQNNAW